MKAMVAVKTNQLHNGDFSRKYKDRDELTEITVFR